MISNRESSLSTPTVVAMCSLVVVVLVWGWSLFIWKALHDDLGQPDDVVRFIGGIVVQGCIVLAKWVAWKYARPWWEETRT